MMSKQITRFFVFLCSVVFLSFTITESFILLTGPWTTEGSAMETILECDTCFQLTIEGSMQSSGCVWDNSPRPLDEDITLEFTLNFGSLDADGADGMTMVFSSMPNQCGEPGGELGVGGLSNALVVEFDTWTDNANPGDMGINADHIAIYTIENMDDPEFGPVMIGNPPINIEDGAFHDVAFIWSAATRTFTLSFDGTLAIAGFYDIADYLGSNEFYLGFTGSTGGFSNDQIVCPGLTIPPPSPPIFIDSVSDVCAQEQGVPFSVDAMGNEVIWTTTGGAQVNGSGESVTVDFGNTDAEICASMRNCVDSDPVCVQVTVHPPPMALVATPPTICDETYDLQDLQFSGLDGSETISYFNTESEAQMNQNPISAPFIIDMDQTIWIRVENEMGCFQILSVNIEFGTLDIQAFPNPTAPLCQGDTMDLLDIVFTENNGNTLVQVNWYETLMDAENQTNFINSIISEGGTYYGVVFSSDGCTDIIEIEVPVGDQPDLTIQPVTLSCTDSVASLIHDGDLFWAYEWTDVEGNIFSFDIYPEVNSPGVYIVEYQNGDGCTNTDSITVLLDDDFPEVEISFDTLSCDNPQGQMSLDEINSSYDYLWEGPNDFLSTDPEPMYDALGEYILRVRGPNGCISFFSVNVVGDSSTLDIDISVSDTLNCNNLQVTVELLTPDSTALWSGPNGFSATGSSITVDTAGFYTVEVTADNGCVTTKGTQVIQDFSTPTLSTSADTLSCQQDSIQIATLSNGITFIWEGPNGFSSADMSPYVYNPGEYSVVATGENGCSSRDTINVVADNDLPSVTLTPDSLLNCKVSSIEIEPEYSGNISIIEWTLPDGTSSTDSFLTISDTGIYTLYVEAPNGCSSSSTVHISSDFQEPVFSAMGEEITCLNPWAQLSSDLVDSALTYNWSGPNGYISLSPIDSTNEAGLYILRITNPDNGCSSVDSILVDIDTITPVIDLITAAELTCGMDSLTLTSTVSPESSTVEWSGPNGFTSGINSPLISDGGLYRIRAESTNGCTQVDSIFVVDNRELPVFQVMSDTLSCRNTPVEINILNFDDQWTLNWTGPGSQGGQSFPIILNEAGQVTISATNPSSACHWDTSFVVFGDTISPSAEYSADTLNCDRNTTTLSNNGNQNSQYTFTWTGPNNFSSNIEEPLVNDPGLYQLILEDQRNGCRTEIIIEVIEEGSVIQTPLIDLNHTICGTELGSIEILDIQGGAPPLEINLSMDGSSIPSTNSLYSDLEAGQYVLEIIDAFGCSYVDTLEILPSESNSLSGPESIELMLGDSAVVSLMSTAQESNIMWNTVAVSCDSCLTTTIFPQASGPIFINGTDENGCPLEWQIFIELLQPRIFVSNIFTPGNQDGINDFFYIQSDSELQGVVSRLQIYNRWGSLVYDGRNIPLNDPTSGWDGTVKNIISQSGVYTYYYLVTLNNGRELSGMGDVTLLR